MRFGENFSVNEQPTLEVLKNTENLPEHVLFSREIRKDLRNKINKDGWPKTPENYDGIEDFFAQGKEIVGKTWQEEIGQKISAKIEAWKQKVEADGNFPDLVELLSDPQKVEDHLRAKQLGVLEPLRKIDSEAWLELLAISSERQLAELSLLNHWFQELPEEKFTQFGFSREELKVFVKLTALQGKYFDQAYLKQIAYADQPGGSEATSFGEEQGAEYLYDLAKGSEGEEVEIKNYKDIFPTEWPRMINNFQRVASEVEVLLQEGKLSDTYKNFPEYIRSLADFYNTSDKEPEKLKDGYEKLDALSARLLAEGCPMAFTYMGASSATGDAGKIDVEMRVGLVTSAALEQKHDMDNYRQIADSINQNNKETLNKVKPAPEVYFNYQPFSFGPNLHYNTRAEFSDEQILCHANAIWEVSEMRELPALAKILPREKIDNKHYQSSIVRETALHEIGHAVSSASDKAVKKRIGSNKWADTLDELKAETVGMVLLNKRLQTENMDPEFVRHQFLAKLGTILEFLSSKTAEGTSGQDYYLSGIAELGKLLDSEVIVPSGDGYEVTDYRKGIEVLADLGQEILDKFYINSEVKKSDIKDFIDRIRKDTMKKSGVQDLLKRLN